MTRMPSSAPATSAARLDGHQSVDVAVHQQRLLDAGRHVGIEPPRFGVRGDRLLEQAAVAAGVDESREELGIVAVARGLVQQPDDRSRGLTGVGLEIRVELVRERQPRIESERAEEGVFGADFAVGRCASMYLPMTRWHRPRCAHAGAKLGSSSRHCSYRSRAPRHARRRCARARWR